MENSKKPTINRAVKATLAGLCNALLLASTLLWPLQAARSQTAALVPNAKQQYLNANGTPLAGGSVYSYVPSTTVPKTTWSDPNQATPNSSPVTLDASGGAFIFGQGNYRQIVKDVNGNTIWDGFTSAYGSASPSGSTGTDTAPVGTILPWAGFNFNVPTNWQLAYGQAVSRTTYAQLLAAITISTTTGNCVSSSTTVSGFADTSQLRVGAPIEASCLPTGDTVASIVNGTSVTVAVAATATGTFTVTAFPWGNGDGVTTFNLPDLRGRILPGADAMGGTAASRLTSTFYGASASAPGVAGGGQSSTASTSLIATNIPTITSVGNSLQVTVNSALNLPASSTTVTDASISFTTGGNNIATSASGFTNVASNFASTTNQSVSSNNTGGSSPPAAVSTAFATIQPSLTMDYIIKVAPNTTGAGGVTSFGGMFGDIVCGSALACAPVGTVNTVSCVTATSSLLGCARPDNSTITVSGGVLTAITSTVTLINASTPTSGFTAGTLLSSNGSTLTSVSLASPPAIGGTTPAAGAFSSLTDTAISGSTQCVQANSSGVLSGSGAACSSGTRILLAVPTTFFVSTAGTDTAGCGLSSGASACRTRGYLFNILASKYDLGGQTVTISIAAGTYTDSLQAQSNLLVGQNSGNSLIFTGDCTSGHRSDVVIQPAAAAGYAYSADSGISYRIQCQVVDQTNQRSVFPSGADIIVSAHGSKIYFGNPSLYGVVGASNCNGSGLPCGPDLTFGCNFNGFNAITAGFIAQVEFDNDFTIDVGRCQVTPTGTVTNGSPNITGVSSNTNVIQNMGIVAANVPFDAYVLSQSTGVITMGCIFTNPCQATGTATETLTITGGGQAFLDLGNGGTGYFNTNGQPDYSVIATLQNYPLYHGGFFFINEGSTINAQSITFVGPDQARGLCSIVKTLSNIDTNLQGIPYLPCHGQSAETTQSSVSLTANAGSITVASTANIKTGMIVADVASPTATFTAGAATMTVSSNSGIAVGAKVTGPGILTGAVVTNIAGTTITVGGCGAGPKCVSGSPLYLSEAGQTVYFSNSFLNASCVVSFISSSTVFNIQADTALGGGCIKATGTAPNLWFQGQVIRFSVYD